MMLLVQVVEQLKAAFKSCGTETTLIRAPAKLKDINDNRLVVDTVTAEHNADKPTKNKTVSGGWYVVEKRRRKPSSNPHHAQVPPANPVRWVSGGRGLLPTPPALASNHHMRKNPM